MYHNQIIDVFFAKQDYGPIHDLVEIKDLYQQIAYLNAYQLNTGESRWSSIFGLEDRIEKRKSRLVRRQRKVYGKESRSKILKKRIKDTSRDNIQMAFVLFRSMEGRERALYAYRNKRLTFRQKLQNCLCFVC